MLKIVREMLNWRMLSYRFYLLNSVCLEQGIYERMRILYFELSYVEIPMQYLLIYSLRDLTLHLRFSTKTQFIFLMHKKKHLKPFHNSLKETWCQMCSLWSREKNIIYSLLSILPNIF